MSKFKSNLDENGSNSIALSDINLADIDSNGDIRIGSDMNVASIGSSERLPYPILVPPQLRPPLSRDEIAAALRAKNGINNDDISDVDNDDELESDDDDGFEPLNKELSGPMKRVEEFQASYKHFIKSHSSQIRWIIIAGLLILFHIFLIFALIHNFQKAETLLYFVIFAWILTFYYKIFKPKFGRDIERRIVEPAGQIFDGLCRNLCLKIAFYALLVAAIAAFLFFDTKTNRSRLYGLRGMAFLIAFMFIFSKSPTRIRWRPVIWGFFVQFIFGLLILRWNWGAEKFSQMTNLIVTFLSFADVGSHFVYGFLTSPPNICKMETVFAFSYLQIIIYCGAVVAVLFYFGIIQAVLKWMGWFMQITLGTTAPESLNACGCVFLGIGESLFLIKPYLIKMTPSEIHAVMTSGFSCIAGSLFVAYIGFGACPPYLLSATVMSAPGSLACSKLLFPETKKSKLAKMEELKLSKGTESNALECLSNGAVAAVEIVMAIIANIIVTLGLIAFFNAIVGYLGSLIGYSNWTIESGVGYLFYPLAYLMGVTENSAEIMIVAKLMGIKTVTNEFVAYQHLGQYVSDGALSPRSAMIATYALCGFSNFQTLGIVLAVLGSMVPKRKSMISSLALRALLAGSISCFMTASLAGVLVDNPTHCTRNERPPCFDVEKFQNISDSLFNLTNTVIHNEL